MKKQYYQSDEVVKHRQLYVHLKKQIRKLYERVLKGQESDRIIQLSINIQKLLKLYEFNFICALFLQKVEADDQSQPDQDSQSVFYQLTNTLFIFLKTQANVSTHIEVLVSTLKYFSCYIDQFKGFLSIFRKQLQQWEGLIQFIRYRLKQNNSSTQWQTVVAQTLQSQKPNIKFKKSVQIWKNVFEQSRISRDQSLNAEKFVENLQKLNGLTANTLFEDIGINQAKYNLFLNYKKNHVNLKACCIGMFIKNLNYTIKQDQRNQCLDIKFPHEPPIRPSPSTQKLMFQYHKLLQQFEKQVLQFQKLLLSTYISFLNLNGGIIYLGLKNKGQEQFIAQGFSFNKQKQILQELQKVFLMIHPPFARDKRTSLHQNFTQSQRPHQNWAYQMNENILLELVSLIQGASFLNLPSLIRNKQETLSFVIKIKIKASSKLNTYMIKNESRAIQSYIRQGSQTLNLSFTQFMDLSDKRLNQFLKGQKNQICHCTDCSFDE